MHAYIYVYIQTHPTTANTPSNAPKDNSPPHTHTDQITSLVTQNDEDCHSHSLNLENKAKKLPLFYPGEKVKYFMKMVELAQHLTFPPKVTLPVMKILLATKAHTLVLYYL